MRLEFAGNRLEVVLEAPLGKPPTLDFSELDSLDEILDRFDFQTGAFQLDSKRHASPSAAQECFSPSVLVLRSHSERYFCVGANVGRLQDQDEKSIGEWVRRGHEVFDRLEDLPLPVIAVVDGYCLGGGLELALRCDFIYATATARFGQTEARLGFISGWGASRLLPRKVGISKAKELFFTSEILAGKEAYEIGLADFLGTREELELRIDSFVEAASEGAQRPQAAFKRIANRALVAERGENLEFEERASRECIELEDTKRRVSEFIEARAVKKR